MSIDAALDHLAAGRLDEAEAGFRAALDAAGASEALHGLGLVALRRGAAEAALPFLAAAEALAPDPRRGHDLAVALDRAGRGDEAEAKLRRLVQASPDYLPPHSTLTELLLRRGDPAGAAAVVGAVCDRAIGARAAAVVDRCLDAFDQIGALPPNWAVLANKLRIAGREAECARILDRRLAEAPDDLRARFIRAMARLAVVHASEAEIDERRRLYAADLLDLDRRVAAADRETRAAAAVEVGMAKPFFLSYQGHDDSDLQRLYGRIVSRLIGALDQPPRPLAGPPTGRIRVGFATSYFVLHSVSKLFRGWIEQLDRNRFEVFGYQFSSDRDPMRDAVAAACDHFRSGETDASVWRRQIAEDGLHALVHLEIGMGTISVRLAAERLAPVQAMAWGHPVTSGLPTMDYFLSSDLMEPPDGQRHYSERLVRLPDLSICYAPQPSEGGRLTRADLGLDPDATVYVCCQSLFKYLPRDDDLFPSIAARVTHAQFLFLGDPTVRTTRIFRARLDAAFAAAGLDPARHVVIARQVPPDSFPSLLKAGDVYLDSIGWSGGNTTLEAVACGLPVVTLPTGLMRGRHTTAILSAMGLADTIAATREDYVARAAALADRETREALVARTIAGRERLWNDPTPVRALEDFFTHAVGDAYATQAVTASARPAD